MSNVLNEIQQLRLSLVKETKFDLDKAGTDIVARASVVCEI